MFADRLLEAVWAQGSRRGWMTLTSLGLQALAAAFLLLLPLMGTTALPQLRPLSPPVSVAPPPEPHPTPSHRQSPAISPGKMSGNVLLAPRRIPIGVQKVADDAAPPQLGASGPMFRAAPAPAIPMKFSNSIGTGAKPALPPPPPPAQRVRLSRMREGDLIYKVKPEYPSRAKRTHARTGRARSRDRPARHDRKPAGPYWPSHVGWRSPRCGHPMALSLLRPQQRNRSRCKPR